MKVWALAMASKMIAKVAVTRTSTAYLVIAELAHALTTEARSALIINAPRQVNVRLDAVMQVAMLNSAYPR